MNEALAFIHSLVDWVLSCAVSLEVPALIEVGVFFVLAGCALLFACGVIFCRNVVHSALCLTATFICVGCLYISIGADFMGAVQILVYGGAVAILIVMALMLTRRNDMARSNPSRGFLNHIAAVAVAGLFLSGMCAVALLSPFKSMPNELGDTVPGLADLMLTRYVLPFEITAVLLLAAMIGAILLAKGADET